MVDEVDADRVVRPARNATFSLVPTPSALATSTGSRNRPGSSWNSPPNDPISDSTPGVNVERASARMRRTVSLPASMSTPDALVVHRQNSSFSISEAVSVRRSDPSGRGPVRRPGGGKELLFGEVFLEAVEPLMQQLDGARAPIAGVFAEPRDRLRRPAQRHRRQRDRDVASQPGRRAFEVKERIDGWRLARGGKDAEDGDRGLRHDAGASRCAPPRASHAIRSSHLSPSRHCAACSDGAASGGTLVSAASAGTRRAIANPAQREHGVVLERSIEADDRDDRVDRVGGTLLAERSR